jgi:hypothetical protein
MNECYVCGAKMPLQDMRSIGGKVICRDGEACERRAARDLFRSDVEALAAADEAALGLTR